MADNHIVLGGKYRFQDGVVFTLVSGDWIKDEAVFKLTCRLSAVERGEIIKLAEEQDNG